MQRLVYELSLSAEALWMTTVSLWPVFLLTPVHVAVHELGHVLAALAVGFRVQGLWWAGGVVIDDGTPEPGASPWRWMLVHLGGLLANLAASAVLASILPGGVWRAAVWAGTWYALLCLVPFRLPFLSLLRHLGGYASDGWRILHEVRRMRMMSSPRAGNVF